jgi:hypothetical protein
MRRTVQPMVVLGGHDSLVTAVCYNSKGLLCSASSDRVLLWDTDVFAKDVTRGEQYCRY